MCSGAPLTSAANAAGAAAPHSVCDTIDFVRNFALIALAAFACTDAPTVPTATATRRALSVPILADGTLEPPPGGEVRAPEAAVIGAGLVRGGPRVRRGGWGGRGED